MRDSNTINYNDVGFEQYKQWFEKYKENNDVREINFQNEVVRRLISTICNELDVVFSDKKGPHTKKHDYLQYCGSYINKKGKEQPATPDLVIAKDWNWFNVGGGVDYRAVVEVKSPYLKEAIYYKDYKEYSKKLKEELERHLSAKINDRVILTDALKWEFYSKKTGLKPIKTIKLYNLTNKSRNIQWEWKSEEKCTVKDNNTEKMQCANDLNCDSYMEEFEKLKKYIVAFLNEEN